MLIEGKHNTAKVFTDIIEESAIQQIKLLCDQEFTKGSKIRIMPDVHTGAGCTIGTTMTIKDCIVPNLVGVDIGCGMEVVKIKNSYIELEKLDKLIHSKIPAGFNIRKTPHKYADSIDLEKLRCKDEGKINLDRAIKSIGTLGGGNHFIEAGKDEAGQIYIVIHSGSRHLGNEVAKFYQDQAYKSLNKNTSADIERLIAEYKAAGRQKEIQSAIAALRAQVLTDIPKSLAYVSGQLMEDYLHDMELVQRFAYLNRKAMMEEIIKGMKLKIEDQFTTIHNYIDTTNMILRKGAVSAQKAKSCLFR